MRHPAPCRPISSPSARSSAVQPATRVRPDADETVQRAADFPQARAQDGLAAAAAAMAESIPSRGPRRPLRPSCSDAAIHRGNQARPCSATQGILTLNGQPNRAPAKSPPPFPGPRDTHVSLPASANPLSVGHLDRPRPMQPREKACSRHPPAGLPTPPQPAGNRPVVSCARLRRPPGFALETRVKNPYIFFRLSNNYKHLIVVARVRK